MMMIWPKNGWGARRAWTCAKTVETSAVTASWGLGGPGGGLAHHSRRRRMERPKSSAEAHSRLELTLLPTIPAKGKQHLIVRTMAWGPTPRADAAEKR